MVRPFQELFRGAYQSLEELQKLPSRQIQAACPVAFRGGRTALPQRVSDARQVGEEGDTYGQDTGTLSFRLRRAGARWRRCFCRLMRNLSEKRVVAI